MTSILDGELAETLVDALNSASIPQALSFVRTEVDPDSPPWDPSSTDVSYPCSGWVDDYRATDRLDGSILTNDRKVFVLVSSLSVTPAASEHLTIDGLSYSIVSVEVDPAGACWVMQARR